MSAITHKRARQQEDCDIDREKSNDLKENEQMKFQSIFAKALEVIAVLRFPNGSNDRILLNLGIKLTFHRSAVQNSNFEQQ